ncbi:hypothetical protein [Nocardia camponoti]|nr:hypothetical protein [Nocardia camponoti]
MPLLDRVGLVAALAAVTAGALVGCTSQVDGVAEANQTDLSSYKSTVSAAASASRAAAVDLATVTACNTLRTVNTSSVRSFNAYIDASNDGAADADTKADAAVTTMRANGTDLDAKITADVLPNIATELRAYSTENTKLADALQRRAPTDQLNSVIDSYNASKDLARTACEAYR